jgi:flagellar assembly factor FliW
MKIATKKLGEIEVEKNSIIHFPSGIIGFEKFNHFTLIKNKEFDPFCWLSAMSEEEEFSLPMIDPSVVKTDYALSLPDSILKEFELDYNNVQIFCVVNLNGNNGHFTINLRSPIIINWYKKSGKQLVLDSDDIPVAEPVW